MTKNSWWSQFASRNKLQGLSTQLFALVIFPLAVILLLIAFGSAYLHQSAMRELVAVRDERAVRAAANALSEQLHHRISAIRGLANQASLDGNLTEVLETANFLSKDFDQGLAFFSITGDLLAASKNQEYLTGIAADWQTFNESLPATSSSDESYLIASLQPDQNSSIVISVTIDIEAEMIVVGAFSLTDLASTSIEEPFPKNDSSAAFVISKDYEVLFRQGNSSILDQVSSQAEWTNALFEEPGTTYFETENEELIVAHSLISPTGWVLIFEESWRSAANPLLRATELGPLLLVPIFLLSLMALWFGNRQIIKPLQMLELKSSALAWGDYKSIEDEVGGITEIGRLQRSLILMSKKVLNAQQSLRGYIGAITKGQEEERQRLARELHDDTIQSLVAINQKVQLTIMSKSDTASLADLTKTAKMVERSIQNLRRITRDLRPPYLEDLGLSASLEMLIEETNRSRKKQFRYSQEGDEIRLKPEIELSLYRIAQEGINNALRHANAKNSSIYLKYYPQKIRMIISDDGKGFNIPENPAALAQTGHFGLLGIHERAEIIGAIFEIQSSLGKGTKIIITLPIE